MDNVLLMTPLVSKEAVKALNMFTKTDDYEYIQRWYNRWAEAVENSRDGEEILNDIIGDILNRVEDSWYI